MKAKYTELMNKVEVSDEMRLRILRGMNEQTQLQKKSKIIKYFNIKNISSVVAAASLLIVGSLAYRQSHMIPDNDPELTAVGFVQLGTLEELEATVGFDMKELETIPFDSYETAYIAYGKETAEIHYQKDEQQIIYTKSTILDGNNGHYESYETEETLEYEGVQITIKANKEGAYIASWQEDHYEYMIYSSEAMSKEELLKLVK